MSTKEQREASCVGRIRREGRLLPGEAPAETERWIDVPWKERRLNHAWHALIHYHHDSDIRARDPSYARRQQEELLSWVRRLRRLR